MNGFARHLLRQARAYQHGLAKLLQGTPNIPTGPVSVAEALTRGLQLIGQPFRLNPPEDRVTTHVGVLSNPAALRWAIQAKIRGDITRLIAGPNLVVTPLEEDGVLISNEIDMIVTPSKWVTGHYESYVPGLRDRIVEWPAGVDCEFWKPRVSAARRYWLLYDKSLNGGWEVLGGVLAALSRMGLPHHLIVYGKYTRAHFRELLREAIAMIVISASESQGIAQFEAWACDVPTLVWDRREWQYRGQVYRSADVSSCPYLAVQCGMRFAGTADFGKAFSSFSRRIGSFQPRQYVQDCFTLQKAALAYARIAGVIEPS